MKKIRLFLFLAALCFGSCETPPALLDGMNPQPRTILVKDDSGGVSQTFDGVTSVRYSLRFDELSFNYEGQRHKFKNISWEALY